MNEYIRHLRMEYGFLPDEDIENFAELLVKEIVRVMRLHRSTITNPDMIEFVKGMEAAIEIVEFNFGESHD